MTYMLGVAYMTLLWLAISAPVTLGLLLLAFVVRRQGALARQPLGLPAWSSYAPFLLLVAIVAVGGVFANSALRMPASWPPAAWGIVALYTGVVIVTGLAVWKARRRWAALAGLAAWLWVDAVAAWVAVWAVTAGGTLGAL